MGVIEDFWAKLTMELLPLSKKHTNVLIGIDANAHFASGDGQVIGDHGLEEQENVSGRCFKDFLHQLEGALPSTFEWIHEGDTTTWTSNVNGRRARCDYFVCPIGWIHQQLHTYPVHWLDEGNSGTDHTPLAIDCTLQQSISRRPKPQKKFDRRALQQADPKWLEQQFADFKSPFWHVSVDRHATTVTSWIGEKLATIFPPVRSRPKKSYISQTTWKMRGERLRLKKTTGIAQSKSGLCTLQHAFEALKEQRPLGRCQVFIETMAWLRLLIVRKRALAGHTKLLTRSLKADRTAMLEEIAEQSKTMSATELAAALRSIGIRSRKKPSGVLPLPMVQNADGQIIGSLEELAETWRKHFARQEDGCRVNPLDLLQEGQEAIEHRIRPDFEDFPTWLELEAAFRRTSKKKAYFDDGVPGDLLAAIPACMTNIFLPLFLKEVLYQREALIYKGGRLVPAFKKGSPLHCENYRSLFVSSPVGKALHSLYRNKIGRQFEQSRCSMQLGGLKGHGITQVSHSIHLCHSWAISHQCSFAVLFVDIQNAFYRLLREHIISGTNGERTVQAIFDSLALPPGTFEEFQAFYDQGPALESSGTRPFMQSLFREFYSRTWFTVPGSEQWTQTKRGSRPGDSFADICFGFALSKLLHRLELTLVHRFPFLQLEWSGNYDPFESAATQAVGPLIPVWADDLALVIFHDSPNELLRLLPEITTEVLHQLAVIGLQPNMKAGKTELLLDLRGQGSLRARQKLTHQDYQIHLATPLIAEALRVVGAYRHLGTVIQLGGRTQKDIKIKFGTAHEIVTKYRAQIFSNRKLHLQHKVQLFNSLVMSTITFNAAAWNTTTKGQMKQIEHGFDRLHKRIAIMHHGPDALLWSYAKVYAYLNAPDTDTVLRVARLRYLAQMVRTGQPHFWALVQLEQRWYSTVVEDLSWLQSLCTQDEIPDGSADSWPLLVDWANRRPLPWKRLLKRAQARAIAHQRRRHEWDQLQRWVLDFCLSTKRSTSLRILHQMNTFASDARRFLLRQLH